MQQAMVVRRMTQDDIKKILEIDQKIVGKERAPSWPQRVSSHLETYYPALCYVAEQEGRVVGFILGDIRGAEYGLPLSAWIDIMGVDPVHQRQGIGRKLVETFIEECRRTGLKTRTMLREEDRRLQGFLHSLGFQRGQLVEFVK